MHLWELTTEERQALLNFLTSLVRTPSFSGAEGGLAVLIADEMQRLGFDAVWLDAAGNVVGRIGPPSGPALMLNSHMDTVKVSDPSAWHVEPFAAEVREGHLYGLGACDMKGGLAATVYGAALLKKRGIALQGPLYIVCVGLEEPAEGTGTRILFEEDQLHPDWVVIAEPSNLQIVRGQRGHVEMLLNVKGRSAHSSAPELGNNAIYAAARLVFNLEILSGQLADDPFLGPGVLAITDIKSYAVSRNAIPDRCEMILDRRLTVGETEAMALLEVQRIINRESTNAEVRVIEEEVTTHTGKVYRVRRASPPWALEERHPLVKAMAQAVRLVGLRPAMARWHFATEGSYTAAVAQVPTIGFGPGNPALPHTVDEHVALEQVYAAAQAYFALSMQLLAQK